MTETLFDPASITNWYSLSAASLLLVAFGARLVVNSKAIEKVTRKHTHDLLKATLNRVTWLALLIVVAAFAYSIFDNYHNNELRKKVEEISNSQRLIQEWAVLDEGDRQQALLTLQHAASEFISYEGHFMYGTALLEAGKFEDAIAVFDAALLQRQTKEAHLNKASALQRLGALEEAKNVLKHGLETESNSINSDVFQAKLNFNLASVYLDLYQKELRGTPDEQLLVEASAALENAKSGMRRGTLQAGELIALKGLLHEMKKEYQQAAQEYERAISLRTQLLYKSKEAVDLGITNNNIASLLLKNNEPKSALSYARAASTIFDGGGWRQYSAISLFNIAEAHEKMGQYDLARENYIRAKDTFALIGNFNFDDTISNKLIRVQCLQSDRDDVKCIE